MSSSWSIANIDNHAPKDVWESFLNHYVAAGTMLGVLVVSLSYPLVHTQLMAKSSVYRNELTRDQQVVVVQHSIEATMLSVIFLPFSYLILSVFFEGQSLEEFGRKVSAIMTFMFVIIIMYMIEIAARHQKLQPLVVAHHICTLSDSIYATYFFTTGNLKSVSLLVYFITYEAITFMGLIMYRLAPKHRYTRPTILTGMIVFGLSRPIQFIWIVGSLIAMWDDIVSMHAVVQILFTTLFSSLQLYSLSIHYALYKKCARMPVHDYQNNKIAEETEYATV